MATTAVDTQNEFADAWASADKAVTHAASPGAAGLTGDAAAYVDAWNGENNGVYGSLEIAPNVAPAAAAAPVAEKPLYRQQSDRYGLLSSNFRDLYSPFQGGLGDQEYAKAMAANAGEAGDPGGYGEFTYGDEVTPGTQKFRDMQEYLSWGGADNIGKYKNGGTGAPSAVQSTMNTAQT